MTQSISRDSFNELKNYLGVYLQQGRVILDADWNENQDIFVSFLRRMSREALGDGSPNRGFAVDPIFPVPVETLVQKATPPGGGNFDLSQCAGEVCSAIMVEAIRLIFSMIFGPLLFFLNFPGKKFDDMESLEGFILSSPQGTLRIGKDGPYEGKGFLRLSGHAGTVTITKSFINLRDLSSDEVLTFRYRLSQQSAGIIRFFLEDDDGNRTVWLTQNTGAAKEVWVAGFAAPLDVRFHITTDALPDAGLNQNYNTGTIFSFGGATPITWSLSAGALPAGLTLAAAGTGDNSKSAKISGTPTSAGSFDFTVQAVDNNGVATTQSFTLKVLDPPPPPSSLPSFNPADLLAAMIKFELPTGTPADLTRIRKYGFEVYQDTTTPLVWDFDDLRIASENLLETIGVNNFIIRGSEFSEFLGLFSLFGMFGQLNQGGGGGGGGGGGSGDDGLQNLLELMNTQFEFTHPSIENAGRMYVAGLPCVLIRDTLYSEQADPNDPSLVPPPPGQIRKDLVYLDVWEEPVTYVEDPEIREIALGGPDTTTRLQVKYRVRVNQGGGLPEGEGIGKGTVATEGVYTGEANRLYRIEIDTAGDIGTATFRWSEDNASTIQRVIAPIPAGSKQVVVEDGSAFHPADLILLSKEFGSEMHQIESVFGNVINLNGPVGGQLLLLPAASKVSNFTSFSMEDRPKIARWNAFKVPITPDPADATISEAISLNDGVAVRFGGNQTRRGDYWIFKTRFLAGDEASGINPETRIEPLSFVLAHGKRHAYAPLAILTRDGDAPDPNKIIDLQDKRQRAGNASTVDKPLADLSAFTGKDTDHFLGGIDLAPASKGSKFLVFWSGELFLTGAVPADSHLELRAAFYNDEMTNPATEPDKGKIQDKSMKIPLTRKQTNVEIPIQALFVNSDTGFLFVPNQFVPTSVQLFARIDKDGFSVELVNMRMTVLELKKSF
ncbi:MAG: putative Ig domain-containing protein [Nitrospirae bacterium]|nr:putative Ig domain-containing protein [Candidatus Manganitrophaceae bacterium]